MVNNAVFKDLTVKSMQATVETIWSSAQQSLRTMLNPDIYNLWFLPVKAVGLEGDTIVLEVANDFCEVWLKDNYLGLIRDVLAQASGEILKIRFRVGVGAPSLAAPGRPRASPKPWLEPVERAGALRAEPRLSTPRTPSRRLLSGRTTITPMPPPWPWPRPPANPTILFFSTAAWDWARPTCSMPSASMWPRTRKSARVTYLSSEKFTNEYIDAIQNNQLVRFRRKYRQADVLLIDDVQFLAGKERIQEEFFHTFNALHEAHKQIVLTCDRPAAEIQNLEQRLVSRFEWGLVTELQPPDVETRLAILRKKGKAMGVELPEEIINFLANRIRTNIRRLEGALIRVASFASLTGKKLTLPVVGGIAARSPPSRRAVTPSILIASRRRWPSILTSAWPT